MDNGMYEVDPNVLITYRSPFVVSTSKNMNSLSKQEQNWISDNKSFVVLGASFSFFIIVFFVVLYFAFSFKKLKPDETDFPEEVSWIDSILRAGESKEENSDEESSIGAMSSIGPYTTENTCYSFSGADESSNDQGFNEQNKEYYDLYNPDN